MNKNEIKEILKLHEMWLNGEEGGERAHFCAADLCGVNLEYANLRKADLHGVDLCDANLSNANLSEAKLCGAFLEHANFYEANLCSADLRGANLSEADLRDANLCSANLFEADLQEVNFQNADLRSANLKYTNLRYANLKHTKLRRANLVYADLYGANLFNAEICEAIFTNAELSNTNTRSLKYNEATAFFAMQCPEKGSFIAYKRCGNCIVELLIPEDAKRSSATTRKCRASKAKVLSIENLENGKNMNEVCSGYDKTFIYKVGETVEVKNFDENRWKECSTGIHFFITRQEAINYR